MKKLAFAALALIAACDYERHTFDDTGSREEFDKTCTGPDAPVEACAEIVIRWASAVSVGLNARTPEGTTARHGTLRHISEMPGAIQIDVEIDNRGSFVWSGQGLASHIAPRPEPTLTVERVRLNGLPRPAVIALARAARPLAEVPLDRVIEVHVRDDDGGGRVGRIDVGPTGALGLESVDLRRLARIGGTDFILGHLDRTTAELVR